MTELVSIAQLIRGPTAVASALLPVAGGADVKLVRASRERADSELTPSKPELKFPPFCDVHVVSDVTQQERTSPTRTFNN